MAEEKGKREGERERGRGRINMRAWLRSSRSPPGRLSTISQEAETLKPQSLSETFCTTEPPWQLSSLPETPSSSISELWDPECTT